MIRCDFDLLHKFITPGRHPKTESLAYLVNLEGRSVCQMYNLKFTRKVIFARFSVSTTNFYGEMPLLAETAGPGNWHWWPVNFYWLVCSLTVTNKIQLLSSKRSQDTDLHGGVKSGEEDEEVESDGWGIWAQVYSKQPPL